MSNGPKQWLVKIWILDVVLPSHFDYLELIHFPNQILRTKHHPVGK